MHYSDIFFQTEKKMKISLEKKMIFFFFFFFFAQNIHCEVVLTSTHNVCFGSEIKKVGIPLYTPVLLHKNDV